MRITLTNLTDRTLAEASHEDVALATLAEGGITPTEHGHQVVFDARALLLAADEIASVKAGGRLVTSAGLVLLEVEGSDRERMVQVPLDTDGLPWARAERRHVNRLLAALEGVTLHDPDRIYIGARVKVKPGAILWGGVVLRGETSIAAAEIGPGCVLTDTRVADGAVLKPYSVCDTAEIGPDAAVGPMAHLRPKARLSIGTKVGNFVEVKNAVLHANAKASHLTYLGDAEIGEAANIGAGTITCNYDGYNKWKTTIGAGAFIGSNSALVAPITIGDGAIVAAGSTLNQDVPQDALALGRANQKNLPKMGERIRRKNQTLKERHSRD